MAEPHSNVAAVPFLDLSREYLRLRPEIDRAIQGVLNRGAFILGPENEGLEVEFARFCGAGHAAAVGSGTDAIFLALRACGISAGDEVITVSHTAVATVAAVRMAGATPVLVDVDERTLTIDPEAVGLALTPRTKAVVAVHLYGLPADMRRLSALTDERGLTLIEDAAQAQGAAIGDRSVGSFGRAAAFSFYPTKNIGAYGDGGIVTTNDGAVADRVRQLRQYGWGAVRYASEIEGVNSRMDEVQAAIVRAKLRRADHEAHARTTHARAYDQGLSDLPIGLPPRLPGVRHAYHLYVIRTSERDALRAHLQSRGIGTAVHYPYAVHQQKPYVDLVTQPLPRTEAAVREILSLPLYPDLREDERDQVIEGIRGFFKGRRV